MKSSNIFQIFIDHKQFQIFILGIFSGTPLYVIYGTLAAWMSRNDVDISIITSFAVTRSFYSFKVFWSPLVDNIQIPILKKLGRRKSWMAILIVMISLIMFAYSQLDPKISILNIFWLTVLLGFTSATLDIVIDAFRIDNIEKDRLSLASANAVFGYRVGGLIAGAGALYVAHYYSWSYVFMMISSLYLFGLFFVFTLKEEKIEIKQVNFFIEDFWKKIVIEPIQDFFSIENKNHSTSVNLLDKKLKKISAIDYLKAFFSKKNKTHSTSVNPINDEFIKVAIMSPFKDFFAKEKSLLILLAIIFYKLGDAFLGVVATPFYIHLGFTNIEIGAIGKLYGFIAIVCGAYLGGVIMYRYGNVKGLLICGFAQCITNLSFIWLNHCGHDINALIITITFENIASGMGDAALVGYLGYLCNKHFSATQYALLTSAAGLFSHTIVGFGGLIVKFIGWDLYFLMTVLLAIPGLIMLLSLNKTFHKS